MGLPSGAQLLAAARQQLAACTGGKRDRAFANPVGWVGSFASVHKLGGLDYRYRTQGPSHAPTFTCTAVLAGLEFTESAPVKAHA